MTTFQKIIKYLAIALALFLIFMIASGIISIIGGISNIFDKSESNKITSKINLNGLSSYLDIKIKGATLNIKKSNKAYVEVSSDKIKVSEKDNKITIEDTTRRHFITTSKEVINLYIPEDYKYDLIAIDAGAGKMNIEYLNTKKLILNLGAGKTVIDSIFSDESKIDAGVGSFSILSGELTNANINLGVGKIDIKAKFYRDNKIKTGIGAVNLVLVDNDYTLKIDKGLGSININGEKIKKDTTIGNGNNILDIDGGIGSINIMVD